MNRLLIAAVVVIVLAIVVMMAIPEQTATTTEIDRPNPMSKIDTSEVTKVVLQHSVGKGDNRHKQRVVLVRREGEGDDDATWALVEPMEDEANQSSVKTLIKRLGDIEITDVASESSSSHEDLEVTAEAGISVEVYTGADRRASFILGKARGGNTMLRLPDQDAVYTARGSLRFVFGKDASDWRDKSIFDVDRDEVSEVTFQNEEGTFRFTRDISDEEAEWTVAEVDALAPPEDEDDEEEDGEDEAATKAPAEPAERARVSEIEDFDQAKVRSIVTSLARLRCTDFLDDTEGVETGLEAEDAPRVSFKVGSGEKAASYSIVLGVEHDKRTVLARRTDDEQVYLLTKHLAKRLQPDVTAFIKRAGTPSKAPRPGGMPGMGGPMGGRLPPGLGGGGSKLPPEVMRQLQEQMMRQKMMKQLSQKAASQGQ